MLANRLWLRAFGRCIVDHCVPRGILPDNGWIGRMFRSALAIRGVQLRASHPLFRLCARSDWTSSYSLSTSSLAWLWWRLSQVHPGAIVEIGSGRSTVMFAMYARKERDLGGETPVVVSIDHDSSWLDRTSAMLEASGVREFATLIHAPLVTVDEKKSHSVFMLPNESVQKALGPRRAQFLLIDGPPGTVGRQDTLPSLQAFLAPHADVFLDDSYRQVEQSILADWDTEYGDPCFQHRVLPLGKGLGWLRTREHPDES